MRLLPIGSPNDAAIRDVVGREELEVAEQRVGGLERPERVLPHGEPMRRRLGCLAHRGHLGEDHLQDGPRVRLADRGRAAREAKEVGQLVSDALGRDRRDGGSRRPGERLRVLIDGEPELVAEPQDAEHAHRVVDEGRGPACAEPARGEVVETTGRVLDGGWAPEERGEVDGQRVDRDVATGEVGVEARRPQVRQIDVAWLRARHDDSRHAVRLAERDERAPEPIGQPAGQRDAAGRQREVDVVQRPPE